MKKRKRQMGLDIKKMAQEAIRFILKPKSRTPESELAPLIKAVPVKPLKNTSNT